MGVLTASDMARLQADLQARGMVPLYPARLLRQGHFDRDYGSLRAMVTVSYRRACDSHGGLRISFDRAITYARPDWQAARREA